MLDKNLHVDINRPTWHESNLLIAIEVSKRSWDLDTKVGSVLVDDFNHIIGTGYNSFPRGFPDNELPNIRDINRSKHKFIIHSEVNCIINTICNTFLYHNGVTLYCTHRPCTSCLKMLINANVKTIYTIADSTWSQVDEEKELFDMLIKYSNITYNEIKMC